VSKIHASNSSFVVLKENDQVHNYKSKVHQLAWSCVQIVKKIVRRLYPRSPLREGRLLPCIHPQARPSAVHGGASAPVSAVRHTTHPTPSVTLPQFQDPRKSLRTRPRPGLSRATTRPRPGPLTSNMNRNLNQKFFNSRQAYSTAVIHSGLTIQDMHILQKV
jgi:hypothetical protein